jgi:phosphoglucosamine mutase
VLDCANGAAAGVSPQVFTDAGATLTVIGADPDGLNINDGVGSTHLGNLARAVLEHGADIGIAHDGDADRCLAVDHEGNVIDGDQIMAILAVSMAERGVLKDRTLVATVMSNLGLMKAMAAHDITVIQTKVGDRYVLEELNADGLSLGGEQSVYPQILVNVRGVDHRALHSDDVIAIAISDAEVELGDTGRVLLRPSGTEPMVRVMVEAADQPTADRLARRLADVVLERLAN